MTTFLQSLESRTHEVGCCVCGEWCAEDEIREYDSIVNSKLLVPDEEKAGIELVQGMILDPSCTRATDEGILFSVCDRCNASLERNKLPSRALANDLAFGAVPPELQNLTFAEYAIISPVRICCHLVILKSAAGPGTGQQALRGHVCIFLQDIGAIIRNVLPLRNEDILDMIHVVFVGDVKPTEAQLRRFFNVSKEKVRAAIIYLLEHRTSTIKTFFKHLVHVFGNVKCYYGVVEAQGRGTLHLHFLVWISGHYSIDEMRERLHTDEVFREQMQDYIAANISAEVNKVLGNDEKLTPTLLNRHLPQITLKRTTVPLKRHCPRDHCTVE